MSDIQVGDLVVSLPPTHACAQCIADDVESAGIGGGVVFTVTDIWPDRDCPCLSLEGYPLWNFGACCFRKIKPYQQRFAEELKRAVPNKEQEHA